MDFNENTLKRFWQKVGKRGPDDCWPWLGARCKKGYGVFAYKKFTTIRANRYALMATFGGGQGLVSMHGCDNPPCCNPRHLSWGTTQQNVIDSYLRGRVSKLSMEDARCIRECRMEGIAANVLAEWFMVSVRHVRKLTQRTRWKYI